LKDREQLIIFAENISMDFTGFIAEFESLPKQLQQQVLDYIHFLSEKHGKRSKSPRKVKFNFDWENGLEELRNKYTSVELQHQANRLR
jgi:hypothetical protein